MIDVVVILVMAFYFMVDGHRIGDLAGHLFPPQPREKAWFVRAAVGQVLGSYIRGQLTLAAMVGAMIAAGTADGLARAADRGRARPHEAPPTPPGPPARSGVTE